LFFREPGLPINKQLWLPAAATSSALFIFSWPFTSEKSKLIPLLLLNKSSISTLVGSIFSSLFKNLIT